MTGSTAKRIADTALSLRRTHPLAPPVDVIDLACQGLPPDSVTFTEDLVEPRSQFGQLIAETFDRAMTPEQWHDWTGPDADPTLRDAVLEIWRTCVLRRFKSRYGFSD